MAYHLPISRPSLLRCSWDQSKLPQRVLSQIPSKEDCDMGWNPIQNKKCNVKSLVYDASHLLLLAVYNNQFCLPLVAVLLAVSPVSVWGWNMVTAGTKRQPPFWTRSPYNKTGIYRLICLCKCRWTHLHVIRCTFRCGHLHLKVIYSEAFWDKFQNSPTRRR